MIAMRDCPASNGWSCTNDLCAFECRMTLPVIKESDCVIDTFSSSAPESGVRITHVPTGISVACKGPSQLKNRAAAWELLRAQIHKENAP